MNPNGQKTGEVGAVSGAVNEGQNQFIPTPAESYNYLIGMGFPEHTAVYLAHLTDAQGNAMQLSEIRTVKALAEPNASAVREFRPLRGLPIANADRIHQTIGFYIGAIESETETLDQYMNGQLFLGLALAQKTEGKDEFHLPIFQVNHAGGPRYLQLDRFEYLRFSRAEALMVLGRLTEHIYTTSEQYQVVMSVVKSLRDKYEAVR
ncbi:MAG: hypothetical protein QY318_01190 [Candidatus Dojkabacteria bacterium]|nr:MAG: hypothetical protein QY318_01190 [Candidatus Dojkabacteria bacterium]